MILFILTPGLHNLKKFSLNKNHIIILTVYSNSAILKHACIIDIHWEKSVVKNNKTLGDYTVSWR